MSSGFARGVQVTPESVLRFRRPPATAYAVAVGAAPMTTGPGAPALFGKAAETVQEPPEFSLRAMAVVPWVPEPRRIASRTMRGFPAPLVNAIFEIRSVALL